MTSSGKRKPKEARKEIPWRNKSPVGWWIASFIERFQYEDEAEDDLNRRCTAWENTVIIKARNREEAYRKAERIGRLGEGGGYGTTNGIFRYEGLTSLLPIYEEVADGAEILWKAYSNRSVKKIKSLVKAKHELEVFDDEDVL